MASRCPMLNHCTTVLLLYTVNEVQLRKNKKHNCYCQDYSLFWFCFVSFAYVASLFPWFPFYVTFRETHIFWGGWPVQLSLKDTFDLSHCPLSYSIALELIKHFWKSKGQVSR